MARATVAPQRFVGYFGHVRTSHHDRNPRRPHGVRHAVCLRRHPRHGANPNQANVISPNVLYQVGLAHPLCVAVQQEHLVTRGRERFEKEHPKVWHEVVRDFVIRIV